MIMELKTCRYVNCQKSFAPQRKWSVFCSSRCRHSHHNESRVPLVVVDSDPIDAPIVSLANPVEDSFLVVIAHLKEERDRLDGTIVELEKRLRKVRK